ncbi:MAG TPA: YggS family pyridoxal phosphate-dependent enzyme [Opitutaceae bacterium]|nr:YggS family pyridoxal phosphate-dependent enzyme [Opitutaceae bacterium]
MLLSYEEFAARADVIRTQIDGACRAAGRDPREVELLAVTKNHPPAAAVYAARYGLRAVGENRVQEAVGKKVQAAAPIAWELIGHLQSNKARVAAEHFDRVQSVDCEKLLELLDRAAAGLGRVLPVLLEINAGADPGKFGATPAATPRLLETALAKKNLRVDGLMAIAPLSDDPAAARRAFAALRALRDQLTQKFSAPLPVLSMGMSGDLAAAIAEGSTLVRIGTALFGARG